MMIAVSGARIAPYYAGSYGPESWRRAQFTGGLSSLGDARPTPRVRPPGAATVETVRYEQPRGEKGVMNSLRAVAKMATDGMTDWRVRSWGISRLRAGGNPQTSEGRARVLLAAMRAEKIWVPDPTNTELIQAAHLTLGDGVNAPVFEGGDCDCLATAMLGAYLATCASIDAKAAVVGHSYRQDRQLEHVLGSILGDDAKWYYVEPSSQMIPFGNAKKPTREVVIVVPSQKLVCDETACFTNGRINEAMFNSGTQFVSLHGGPGALSALSSSQLDRLQSWYEAGRDDDTSKAPAYHANRREVRAQLAAAGRLRGAPAGRSYEVRGRSPGLSALEQLHAPAGWQPARQRTLGADDIPAVATATAAGWSAYLAAASDDLLGLQKSYHALYDAVLDTAKELGLPKFDDRFTAEKEADLVDLDAMIAFLSKVLREASTGVRRTVIDGAQWGIEKLPGDKIHLQTVLEDNGTESVVMIANAPQTTESRLAYGPLAIAGLVAAGLAAMGVHFLIIKALAQSANTALQSVLQFRLQAKYIDCINSGLCTPAQVVALQKAFSDAAVATTNARTDQIKAENKPVEEAASTARWLIGLAALVTGVFAGYAFKDEIKSFYYGGSRGSGKSSNASGARTQRNPGGSRTPGGTMISRY